MRHEVSHSVSCQFEALSVMQEYPSIPKYIQVFFEILVCFSSHSRPRSFKLIQVDVVERGVSRWTLDQKASQHKQNHPNNGSVLFWSGSTDSDGLDFASLASAALRDFHRCVCPISGRRRERFLSETSRASNPNSSCRVLVDFLEVSHFHKGKL